MCWDSLKDGKREKKNEKTNRNTLFQLLWASVSPSTTLTYKMQIRCFFFKCRLHAKLYREMKRAQQNHIKPRPSKKIHRRCELFTTYFYNFTHFTVLYWVTKLCTLHWWRWWWSWLKLLLLLFSLWGMYCKSFSFKETWKKTLQEEPAAFTSSSLLSTEI